MEVALANQVNNDTTAIVLLSGGYESAYCALHAKQHYNKVIPYFFDYDQPYLIEESMAAYACSISMNLGKLQYKKIEVTTEAAGVFNDRNKIMLEHVIKKHKNSNCVYYLGCRAPLRIFDKYKDSNRQFANDIEKQYGVVIKTPALLLPKAFIKYWVHRNLTDVTIYTSEGYNYEDE